MLNLALIAHCPRTGNIGGLAYADRRAVGSRLMRVHHSEGVAACLGVTNPLHFDWCFKALQKNITPEEALITSRLKDPQVQHRQLLLIDREGIAAVRTGKKVPAQADQMSGPHFAAGGTGLRKADTVKALVTGFLETQDTDLPLENRSCVKTVQPKRSEDRSLLRASGRNARSGRFRQIAGHPEMDRRAGRQKRR